MDAVTAWARQFWPPGTRRPAALTAQAMRSADSGTAPGEVSRGRARRAVQRRRDANGAIHKPSRTATSKIADSTRTRRSRGGRRRNLVSGVVAHLDQPLRQQGVEELREVLFQALRRDVVLGEQGVADAAERGRRLDERPRPGTDPVKAVVHPAAKVEN